MAYFCSALAAIFVSVSVVAVTLNHIAILAARLPG